MCVCVVADGYDSTLIPLPDYTMTTHRACLKTVPQPLCFSSCLNNWKGKTQHTHSVRFYGVHKQRAEFDFILCVVERQRVQLPEASPIKPIFSNNDPKLLV